MKYYIFYIILYLLKKCFIIEFILFSLIFSLLSFYTYLLIKSVIRKTLISKFLTRKTKKFINLNIFFLLLSDLLLILFPKKLT